MQPRNGILFREGEEECARRKIRVRVAKLTRIRQGLCVTAAKFSYNPRYDFIPGLA